MGIRKHTVVVKGQKDAPQEGRDVLVEDGGRFGGQLREQEDGGEAASFSFLQPLESTKQD